jgi:hypothetical protein
MVSKSGWKNSSNQKRKKSFDPEIREPSPEGLKARGGAA